MARQIELLAAKTGSPNSIPQSHMVEGRFFNSHKLACNLHRKAWCRLTLPRTHTHNPHTRLLIIIVIIILFIGATFKILKIHKTKNISCFPFNSNPKTMKGSGRCTQKNLKCSLARNVGIFFIHKVIGHSH